MSVLVPSFPSSTNSHHHYFPNRYINGNHSQPTNRLTSKINEDINHDHVPLGVVNSMKQRLLDKVNESLLLNNRQPSRLSSNENLLQIKPTVRLSRSQENLLNNHTESLTSYLQPKQDVIIIDTTITNDEAHRHSYTELHVDEVPKPGTVSTVKNMFERQIRLSRYDSEKVSNTSTPRMNHQHRDILSPNRSRSISPNDMALRQKRASSIPTSYPDVVISHTPPITAHMEITNEQIVIENKKKEDEMMNTNVNQNLLLPSTSSSDNGTDYQPLDFKSRLALFNRANTVERSNEHSTNIKKPSVPPPPPPNFITKPIVHHHVEKKDIPSDQNTINPAKAITFFGGSQVNGNTKSSLPTSVTPPPVSAIRKSEQLSMSAPFDLFRSPDFIGGNVKLSKSSIFSGTKKDSRVKFIENVDTFEYPSFNFAMAELSSPDSDSESDNKTPIDENITNQTPNIDDDELDQLARINADINSNNLTEKPLQSKGTLHTFRPTYIDQYELGSQHDFNMSDKYSYESYLNLLDNFSTHSKSSFDLANNIQWSSMSTTTDLLF